MKKEVYLKEVNRCTGGSATETITPQPAGRAEVRQLPPPGRDALTVVTEKLGHGGSHRQQEEGEEPHRELLGKAQRALSRVV